MVKKKKNVVRTSKAAKGSKTTTKVSPKVLAAKSPKMSSGNSWFSWFKIGAAGFAFAVVAGVLSFDSSVLHEFQANIMGQLGVSSSELADNPSSSEVDVASSPGTLIAYDINGENEKKLLDIFATVFPDAEVKTVAYDSPEGKKLVSSWEVAELPALFFEKTAFEKEKLSEVVGDLFTPHGNHYSLNVSLVNPSGQARIKGPLHTEGGIWVGDQSAPITVYVYSDVKCQHCRVQERNNQSEFKKLIDEGLLRMVYLDLPKTADSMTYSTALQCFYEQQKNPETYLDFREKLFRRPNLTKAFTLRELENAGIDYDKDCHADALQALFKNRLKLADADGVTGLPTLYIGKSDGQEFIRFTGEKKFAEYQAAFDRLLGQGGN